MMSGLPNKKGEIVKPGCVLVLDCDTKLSNYVRRFTGSDWTHVALMGSDGRFLDYAINGRRKSVLDDLLNDPCVNRAILVEPPSTVNVNQMVSLAEDRFNESSYDRIAILRLLPKLINGRDDKNLHWFKRQYTCSSLIARCARLSSRDDPLPNGVHYSQTIPDDYCVYWRQVGL